MRTFLDTFMHYGPVITGGDQLVAQALLPKKWHGVFFATPKPNGPNGMNCCDLGILRRTVFPRNLYANAWKFKIGGLTGGDFGSGTLCAFSAVDVNHQLRDVFSLRLEPDGTISIYGLDVLISRSAAALHPDTFYTLECNVKVTGTIGHPIHVDVFTHLNGAGFLVGEAEANINTEAFLNNDPSFTSVGFGASSKGQSSIALPIIYDSLKDPGAIWNITAERDILNQPIFWLGDCKAGVIFPDADGAIQWASTGGTNFSQILSNPPDLAKYVHTSTNGDKDSLDWDDIANFPVMTAQYNLYSVGGSRQLQERLGPTSATNVSDLTALAENPLYVIGGRDNDPTTGFRWTKGTFDPTQWGYELVG